MRVLSKWHRSGYGAKVPITITVVDERARTLKESILRRYPHVKEIANFSQGQDPRYLKLIPDGGPIALSEPPVGYRQDLSPALVVSGDV